MQPLVFRLYRFLSNNPKQRTRRWQENFNRAFVDFPNGFLADWTFGLVYALLIVPALVVSIKFTWSIFDAPIFFVIEAVAIFILLYYWIEVKCADWIDKRAKALIKRNRKNMGYFIVAIKGHE